MTLTDADVPAWWQRLGVPGLADIHTHFMPDRLMDAVWSYFDEAPRHYGAAWPIQYRTPVDERLATLDALGVRRFTALLYPHKPGMAEALCRWAVRFGSETPGCTPSATFYPEPGAAGYVAEALEAGARVFKVHVQVGGFDPRDELLDPVWGQLADAGVPVVVHCGSGPIPGNHTGPGPMAQVLAAHPQLTAVIAHCGAPEYDAHLDLVERYPNVHVDTTMVGTDYMNGFAPLPDSAVARLGELGERVVLGSDFPNIPYPYAEQLDALERLGLGDDWLRSVVWDNGIRLLGR